MLSLLMFESALHSLQSALQLLLVLQFLHLLLQVALAINH